MAENNRDLGTIKHMGYSLSVRDDDHLAIAVSGCASYASIRLTPRQARKLWELVTAYLKAHEHEDTKK